MQSRADQVAREIVDGAVAVHRELGQGLLESAYQTCLKIELIDRGMGVKTEVPLDIEYRGRIVSAAYRLDMVVEGLVLIENKAVERLLGIHEAQVLTYLRLGPLNLGFLLNWNVRLMKDGIRRLIV